MVFRILLQLNRVTTMRSIILAAAFALSVSALPTSNARGVSVADALVARAPQFGPFGGRGESDDDDEDEIPTWVETIPKSSPRVAPKPSGGPQSPKSSAPPPRQGLPLKVRPHRGEEEDDKSETALKLSAGPGPEAGPGSSPSSWQSGRPSAPLKGNRPLPKSAPWSPPKAQQSKPKSSGPPPPREPPFPDAEEDDEKIKAVNRRQREPNAWELDQ